MTLDDIIEFHTFMDASSAGRRLENGDRLRYRNLLHALRMAVSPGELRHWKRAPLSRDAELVTGEGVQPTLVRDASVGGFRIHGPHTLDQGEHADLLITDGTEERYRCRCVVVWVRRQSSELGLRLLAAPYPARPSRPPGGAHP
jgi:hypothetical protein